MPRKRTVGPAVRLRAILFGANSADDEENPPQLGIMKREMKKVSRGRYILLPTSEKTCGHGTHTRAVV